ncbi:hypothetical protein ACFXG4_03480 [Nocardia sp. NPDC059246]
MSSDQPSGGRPEPLPPQPTTEIVGPSSELQSVFAAAAAVAKGAGRKRVGVEDVILALIDHPELWPRT